MKLPKWIRFVQWFVVCSWLIAAFGLPAQNAAPSDDTNTDTNTLNAATDVEIEPIPTVAEAARTNRGIQWGPMILFRKDAVVNAQDSAEAVVVIGGGATIHGRVEEGVVTIGGDVEIDGEVDDTVVAILGDVRLREGARVREVVTVGGTLQVDPGATMTRESVVLDFEKMFGLEVEWLKSWFMQCVLKLRPLAPQVGWVWWFAGGFFLAYLFITMAFPRPVQASVNELLQRPATGFVSGLLGSLLFPILIALLAATGIGLLVVPFLLAAAVLGLLVGKAALLEYLGIRLARGFGADLQGKPLLAVIIGTPVILLLYLIPVVGLLAFAVVTLWGLGAATNAMFAGMRRERPNRPAAPPPSYSGGVSAGTSPAAGHGAGESSEARFAGASAPVNPAPGASDPPLALAQPLAGFWERMGAAFLDVALVCVIGGWLGPFGLLIALAYFSGMWAWKATTIGGIVLRLQVVRVDGGPVTFLVALVRGLAAAFSSIVLFLGFIWIAWDRDKQAWHDKIAGTVVVRLPHSTALVCI